MSATKTDVLSDAQRRYCMSRNRGRDTAPEIELRKLCWSLGLRYSLNTTVFGRPDFVFRREKVAVFVDGCFWHGCPAHYNKPSNRSDFWREKLTTNRARDQQVTENLTADGWMVLRVWEHDLNNELARAICANEISAVVRARRRQLRPHGIG